MAVIVPLVLASAAATAAVCETTLSVGAAAMSATAASTAVLAAAWGSL